MSGEQKKILDEIMTKIFTNVIKIIKSMMQKAQQPQAPDPWIKLHQISLKSNCLKLIMKSIKVARKNIHYIKDTKIKMTVIFLKKIKQRDNGAIFLKYWKKTTVNQQFYTHWKYLSEIKVK